MLNEQNALHQISTISDALLDIKSIRAIVIASRANSLVVSRLVDGALRALSSSNVGASQISLLQVHGALEIPLALKKVAQTQQFNTFIVVGAVIKGRTDHFAHVSRMANDGTLKVALEHQLALGNGILTVHNLEQAMERADGPAGNVGFDAAKAALGLSAIYLQLDKKVRALL